MVEASLARQYEKEHTKEEILEQYLNIVYFGANAYGAEAAALTYYNKEAADLTLPESALLAEEYGERAIYEGGLKIYTTLDPNFQELAVSAVGKVIDPKAGDPSASLVSVEPSTGAVKAMVGARTLSR